MIKAEDAKKIANIKNEIECKLLLIGEKIEITAKQGKYRCNFQIDERIVSEIFNQLRKYGYKISASGYEQDGFVELVIRW